jgi:hypothetical protein
MTTAPTWFVLRAMRCHMSAAPIHARAHVCYLAVVARHHPLRVVRRKAAVLHQLLVLSHEPHCQGERRAHAPCVFVSPSDAVLSAARRTPSGTLLT